MATGKEALDAAIVIWTDRADGIEMPKPCPLCIKYPDCNDRDCEDCEGNQCPLMQITGESNCENTPYQDWINATAGSDEERFHAQTMLDLLESAKATLDL